MNVLVDSAKCNIDELRAVIHVEKISEMHAKKKHIVVLDSGHFQGNIKHLVLYTAKNVKKNEKIYFVTTNPVSHQFVTNLGIEGILLTKNEIARTDFLILLESSIVITDSTFSYGTWNGPALALAALNGAKWIQMWHGIPLKKIEFDNLPSEVTVNTFSDGYLLRAKSNHTFIGTTNRHKEMYKKSFGFLKYRTFGYPRNDCLNNKTAESDLINTDKKIMQNLIENHELGKRNFLYAPTFRDSRLEGWLNIDDLMKLASKACEKSDALFVALHPYDKSLYEKMSQKIQNVCFIDPTSDIYPILRYFDLVISDYSSLIFDLLHLPIAQVLFTPDLESYHTKSRFIDFRIMKYPVGPVVNSIESLVDCIYTSNQAFDIEYTINREKLFRRLFRYRDSNSSKRILKYLRKLL